MDTETHNTHLKWEIGNQAGDTKADEEDVGEDEGTCGIGDFLNLFVSAFGLGIIPGNMERTETLKTAVIDFLAF